MKESDWFRYILYVDPSSPSYDIITETLKKAGMNDDTFIQDASSLPYLPPWLADLPFALVHQENKIAYTSIKSIREHLVQERSQRAAVACKTNLSPPSSYEEY